MRAAPALLGGVLAPALVAVAMLFIVPAFAPLLAQIGELPWSSRAVLATYQWWLFVPAAIACLLAATGWHRTRTEQVASAGGALSGCLLVVAGWSLYHPIFLLAGTTV